MTDETRSHTPDEERPNEEKIGELLRRYEGLYHDPPATPREALWERIEAERGKADGAIGGAGSVIPLAPRRWWLGTLAVAAVLALGIALGRISMREEAEREGAAGPPVATLEAPVVREPETGARVEPIAEPDDEASAPGQLAAWSSVRRVTSRFQLRRLAGCGGGMEKTSRATLPRGARTSGY